MRNTNITNFRQNAFEFVNQAIVYNDVINISTKNGNAVVMSEQDYNAMMETLYLLSIPGMEEKLIEGKKTKPEDCEDFEW